VPLKKPRQPVRRSAVSAIRMKDNSASIATIGVDSQIVSKVVENAVTHASVWASAILNEKNRVPV
jgi:hypothetical protein